MKIGRRAYVEMFGPTTGDRVRLADTELVIEVEKDFTVYGEEVKFGGGKVIRDGMGQSQRMAKDCADTVIRYVPGWSDWTMRPLSDWINTWPVGPDRVKRGRRLPLVAATFTHNLTFREPLYSTHSHSHLPHFAQRSHRQS